MKKAFLLICLMAAILAGLTSCVKKDYNDYNKGLVGTWSFSCAEWQEGQKVNEVEGVFVFEESNYYEATLRYNCGITVNIEGEWGVLDEKNSLLKFFNNSVQTRCKSRKTRQYFNDKFSTTDHLMSISEFSDDKFEAFYSPMLDFSSLDKTTITFNHILSSNDDSVGK